MTDQDKVAPCCAFIHSDRVKEHLTGPGHPERPERSDAVKAAAARLQDKLLRVEPQPCKHAVIALAHDRAYIDRVEKEVQAGATSLSTGDTNICNASHDIALLSAGGVTAAVDLIMEKKVKRAFSAMRPPGHHANASRGMGFCLFNSIAVGARYAQKKHGAERVLIVDWDVHHGNGTQDIFYEDGSVLFFSTHQSPLYPGTGPAHETGEGKGKGLTINRPFPAGTGPRVIDAFRKDLVDAANQFKPDLVMISAGFDSHKDDPLGGMILTDEDFGTLTSIMMDVAEKHCDDRLVSVLEGGYNLDALETASRQHLKVLAEV